MSSVQNMIQVIKGKIMYHSTEKRSIYHHLPSIPCACFGVIASGLCDENMNFTLSFREIFTALRMRYEGKLGLSLISHLSLQEQNDLLIKLSCFL